MKHVSDRDRFSIIQPALDCCYVCQTVPVEIHECIGGTANRQKCKDYGLTVALCPKHHREAHKNKGLTHYLKAKAQRAFMVEYGEEKWMEVFGKLYE